MERLSDKKRPLDEVVDPPAQDRDSPRKRPHIVAKLTFSSFKASQIIAGKIYRVCYAVLIIRQACQRTKEMMMTNDPFASSHVFLARY